MGSIVASTVATVRTLRTAAAAAAAAAALKLCTRPPACPPTPTFGRRNADTVRLQSAQKLDRIRCSHDQDELRYAYHLISSHNDVFSSHLISCCTDQACLVIGWSLRMFERFCMDGWPVRGSSLICPPRCISSVCLLPFAFDRESDAMRAAGTGRRIAN
jgi:hypothetical protein